jgi:hypothetical protein
MKTLAAPSFLRENSGILIISVIGILIHVAFSSSLGFHRDELLYFSLGEHPAFGYHSTPPFIGILSRILTGTLGYTLFAARIIPAILGGALIYLTAIIARELNGGKFSQLVAAVSMLCNILFLRAFGMLQPVPFDVFFWTLTFYFLIRFINTGSDKYVIWFFITLAIGFLNKYNIVFLAFPVGLFLIVTNYRKILVNKYFYLGLGIAFVIVLPNIIWQIAHGFPVVNHMSELKESQLVNMKVSDFLLEQLLIIFPATIIALPGLAYLLINKDLKKYRFLGIMTVAIIILYLVLHGKSYYTAGIYPLLIAAGSLFYERYIRGLVPKIVFFLVFLPLAIGILPLGMPIFRADGLVMYFDKVQEITGNNSIRRYENNQYYGLPQDYADMLGWDELTEITYRAWQKSANKTHCKIFAENYGEAGAITILGKKHQLPEAISFCDAFRYWAPPAFDTEITDLIYINSELGDDIRQIFENIEEIGRITNPLARESGVQVYLCTHPVKSFNGFWSEAVNARK